MPDDNRKAVAVPKHPGILRKGSRYQVRYRHRGQQKARSFRTLSEADRFKAKLNSGDTQVSSRKPFKTYALEWIDSYTGRTARGVSNITRESYRDALDRFAIPFFGTVPLDRIDAPMLRAYIAHLSAQLSYGDHHTAAHRTLSPATVRRFYAPVRAMLATAYEDGLLRTNPAAGVRVIVADTRPRKPKWLTPEQTRALLAEIPATHSDLAYFLAATGCRISEALGATWEDITTTEDGVTFSVRRSKTEAGLRTMVLSPQLAKRLTVRRSQTRYGAISDQIFPTAVGTPIDPRNWRRNVFDPAAERAGVEWATPHKLRHGLASLMADRGYSAGQIAARLGHADGGVLALRTYIHADRLDSTEFIDAAFTD